MLLVDDDQAEIFDRGEDRASCSDDNARPLIEDFTPLIVPLPFRKVAMENGHLVFDFCETAFKTIGSLRSQSDFGHENDGAFPRLDRLLDRLKIDFRLPAPGDAVE